jgi:RNA polymerase sigma-70 factor (ECF subfamily)
MSKGEPGHEGSELRVFLARIRAGDEAAARELLSRYEPQVRLVVRRQLPRILRAQFDSLDFVQSVWGSFFRRMRTPSPELEDPRNLMVFLARAARNKLIDEYRRALTKKKDVRTEESLWEGDRPRELVAEEEGPTEIAEAREALQRLRELIPEGRRAILELKAEGFSHQEIGAQLGLSERTVRRVIADLRRQVLDADARADADEE